MPNSDPPLLTQPYAITTTDQTVTMPSANMYSDVTTVVGPIRAKAVQEMGSFIIFKLLPWTPSQPFILKHELSYCPDKVFVRRLIYPLQHGYTIGYTGPQFIFLASNLQSAYQQPEVIHATLKDECEAG